MFAIKNRKVMSLKERINVLKKIDEGKSCHAISSELGVGKTQIQAIVKERDDIQRRWESGEQSDKKYVKPRTAGYNDLDKLVWEWFTIAGAKNIPVSGRMIQEQVLIYAAELGHELFPDQMDGSIVGRSSLMFECLFYLGKLLT